MTKTVDRILPIVVDTPTAEPKLGYPRYVDAIVAAIMGGQPANYTVGIFGPWGTGKSSILKMLENRLKSWAPEAQIDSDTDQTRPPIVVQFDAWRFDSTDILLKGLLAAIQAEVSKTAAQAEATLTDTSAPDRDYKAKLATALKSTSKVIQAVASNLEFSLFGLVELAVKAPDANSNNASREGASSESSETQPAAPLDSYEAVASFKRIGRELDGQARIVVLVDDLDRCSPEGVVKVIEALHILTDIRLFVVESVGRGRAALAG